MSQNNTCNICFQSINTEEDIICNNCASHYHRDHLAAWIMMKHDSCPICKKQFDKQFVDKLVPKTEEEIKYLKSLDYVFSNYKTKKQTNVEQPKPVVLNKNRNITPANSIKLFFNLIVTQIIIITFIAAIFNNNAIFGIIFSMFVLSIFSQIRSHIINYYKYILLVNILFSITILLPNLFIFIFLIDFAANGLIYDSEYSSVYFVIIIISLIVIYVNISLLIRFRPSMKHYLWQNEDYDKLMITP